jgi:hypothetical protein
VDAIESASLLSCYGINCGIISCSTHIAVLSTLLVSLHHYSHISSFYHTEISNSQLFIISMLSSVMAILFVDDCLLLLLQEILRQSPDHNIAPAVAHFLNCFAGKVLAASTKGSAGSTQSKTQKVCNQS